VIRVVKSADPPAKLCKEGARETKSLCDAFDSAPDDHLVGTKTFEFKSKIYGHSSVKDALLSAQHGKCCFCESKVPHVSHGDVEHFRPKAGFQQLVTDKLGRPGYYWLAYDWDNLFFCCQICNQRHKKNLFPLLRPKRRARSHGDSIADEEPLFISPSEPQVEKLIRFREEYPYAVRGNRRAKATIEQLGLTREDLAEKRKDYLTLLRIVIGNHSVLLAQFPDDPRPADVEAQLTANEQSLRDRLEVAAEYTAMARAAIGDLIS